MLIWFPLSDIWWKFRPCRHDIKRRSSLCLQGWENLLLLLLSSPLLWWWLGVDAGAKATDQLVVVDSPAPYTQVRTVTVFVNSRLTFPNTKAMLSIGLVPLGSPGLAQSSHGSESSPKQDSSSAVEASETTTEASLTVSRSSIQQLRTSPSMPSLSSCAAGIKHILLSWFAPWVCSLDLQFISLLVPQDQVGPVH